MRRASPLRKTLAAITGLLALAGPGTPLGASAQVIIVPLETPPLLSMTNLTVPEPPNLGDYVRNRQAAVVLGKAFFWDMQVGSDGIQACASCHFHAGGDNRTKNQLNPDLNHTAGAPLNARFDPTASGGGGPNYTLRAEDFPFHQLADPTDRNSTVLFDSNDVSSSQGVFKSQFGFVTPRSAGETCTSQDDIFKVGGINVRRVEPRNTPTTINSALNFRNLWDGRANNVFNGVNNWGARDVNARILELEPDGSVIPVQVRLVNSSTASVAAVVPGNPFNMSCGGRSMKDIGRKLLTLRPLAKQKVDVTDSVLGPYVYPTGLGLKVTYAQLIKQAFQPKYWMASGTFNGYTQMESNFSLFWGLAIQLYSETLLASQTRYDAFVEGDPSALTAEEQLGLQLFQDKGRCIFCHKTPEFTAAATNLQLEAQEGGLVERMLMGDAGSPLEALTDSLGIIFDIAGIAIYDQAFYNIGVVPTANDIGLGGKDPFGNPFSFARQAKIQAAGGNVPDQFSVDPSTFHANPGAPVDPNERDAVDGAFKVPGLRNIELTGPYFHNGGVATLEQVVEFYNRGGNRRNAQRTDCPVDANGDNGDTTGFGAHCSNLDADITPLGLSADQQAALVAFLKSLTDERVRWEMAPFDHPQLLIPNGHPVDQTVVLNDGTGKAVDELRELPAVGATGRAVKGLGPLMPFLQ